MSDELVSRYLPRLSTFIIGLRSCLVSVGYTKMRHVLFVLHLT